MTEDRAAPQIEPAIAAGTGVQSVDRALSVLKTVAAAEHPLSVLEVAERCGLNRTTVWRLLGTLERHALVERNPLDRYRIGYGVAVLARSVTHEPLTRLAAPILERLARRTGEISALVAPVGADLTYVFQADPPGRACPSWLGKVIPAHADSPGKVYAAWLPPGERDFLFPGPLERFTPTTVTDRAALDVALAEARRRGYATGIGEHEEFTNGIAAPLLAPNGRPLAAIQIWGPAQRMPPQRLEDLAPVVIAAAREAETRLC